MDDQSKHIKLFTGSLIEIQRLQIDLDDSEIPSMVKNNFQSGLRPRTGEAHPFPPAENGS